MKWISREQHVSTKETMDGTHEQRKKKSDKAKEKYERNGGFSQKHVRLQAALAEKRVASEKKKP